jgi:hypothetical protein
VTYPTPTSGFVWIVRPWRSLATPRWTHGLSSVASSGWVNACDPVGVGVGPPPGLFVTAPVPGRGAVVVVGGPAPFEGRGLIVPPGVVPAAPGWGETRLEQPATITAKIATTSNVRLICCP